MFNPKSMIKKIAKAKEVPSMTAQQIFEVVANHLFAQNQRSFHSIKDGINGVYCSYRGPDKLKCAFGVLIPDSVYQEVWDRKWMYTDKVLDASGSALDSLKPHSYLVNKLRTAHDRNTLWRSTKRMQAALAKIALQFGLDNTKITSLNFVNR